MKKAKYVILIVGLLLINLSFLHKIEMEETLYDKSTLSDATKVEEIEDKYEYNEELYIYNDNLKYLDIYFNKDDVVETTGKYKVRIYSNNKKLLEEEIPYNLISSDGIYRLSTKKLKKGNYKLVIKYSGESTTFSPILDENEKIQKQYFYKNTTKQLLFYALMIASSIAVVAAFIVLDKKKNISIEKKFLIIGVPIFIGYMLLMPMFIAHDERFHWFRIYEITEGGILPEIKNNSTGYDVPDAVHTSLPYSDVKYGDLKEGIKDKIDENNKSFVSDVTMSVYSPIQYLPHIIGVMVGKIVTVRPVLIAFIGRLFNLIISLALLYLAIKIIPFGKNIMLIFSIIPISIEGFTSLSGDGFTICIAYLLIAYIFKLVKSNQKKLTKKDYIALLSLGTIIAFCKLVYIPIVFLMYLLPEKYFKSKKDKFIKITLICLVLLVFNLIWLKLANPYLEVYTQGKSSYQVKYIFSDIIRYAQIFLNSFITQFKDLLFSMYGESLLWSNYVYNYSIVPISLMIITIITCIFDSSLKKQFNTKSIIIISIISIMIVGLIFTSLYVQWTPYAWEKIIGVQGRYFLPFIPLVFIIIGNFTKKEFKLKNDTLTNMILYTAIIVNYMSIIEMLIKFI